MNLLRSIMRFLSAPKKEMVCIYIFIPSGSLHPVAYCEDEVSLFKFSLGYGAKGRIEKKLISLNSYRWTVQHVWRVVTEEKGNSIYWMK